MSKLLTKNFNLHCLSSVVLSIKFPGETTEQLTLVFFRRSVKLLRTTKLGGEPVITPVPPTNKKNRIIRSFYENFERLFGVFKIRGYFFIHAYSLWNALDPAGLTFT